MSDIAATEIIQGADILHIFNTDVDLDAVPTDIVYVVSKDGTNVILKNLAGDVTRTAIRQFSVRFNKVDTLTLDHGIYQIMANVIQSGNELPTILANGELRVKAALDFVTAP